MLPGPEIVRQQRLSLWTMRLPPHNVKPSLLPGPLSRACGVDPPFPDRAGPSIATAFGSEPLTPSGMPEETAVISEVLSLEGVPAACPFTLPPELVPPLQPPQMGFERLAC